MCQQFIRCHCQSFLLPVCAGTLQMSGIVIIVRSEKQKVRCWKTSTLRKNTFVELEREGERRYRFAESRLRLGSLKGHGVLTLTAIVITRTVKVHPFTVQALRLCTGRMAHRGSRGIALFFLDHSTRRGWGVSVTHRPLFTPGKTRYPLYRRLGGPQGRSGQVRKISPPPSSP